MITCKYIGGLGNQLFIIFNCISYSIQYNKDIQFLYSNISGSMCGHRNTYWDTLLIELKNKTNKNLNYNNFKIIKENTKIPINEDNICFVGYFQSLEYFYKNFDKILEIISLSKIKQNIYDKYKNTILFENSISLHIRLGDYKFVNKGSIILDYSYYHKCLTRILSENKAFNIYCFFEQGDDIDKTYFNKMTHDFPLFTFYKINHSISDWEQLILMSLMNYNIIANSTFSYWGALFNNNKNKKIYYPDTLHNHEKLCFDNWILIK